MLKKGMADIVASDAHGTSRRASHMGECREYVAGKYGEDYAGVLFCGNPQKILDSGRKRPTA